MRIGHLTRRLPFLLAAGIFLIVCYLLYTSLEAANVRRKDELLREQSGLDRLQNKLQSLEKDLRKPGQPAVSGQGQDDFPPSTCPFSSKRTRTSSDVQMLSVYDALSFDNPDGGTWKQGWPITYDQKKLEQASKPLTVFLVPHSHCDPGWIKTFDQYYMDQTKHILDNMLSFLSQHKDMKFIYAEMSFFEKWWRDIDNEKRKTVKLLLKSGQFEIVTGGWVMTDEANSHYYTMADQLIEGNQWLSNHLDFSPKNHWSIDPFGLSPTMAYLLSRANFSTMTIQRVHYSVKKYLAKQNKLEFNWRQMWSDTGADDMQTHLFPFYSYDVPHTCGPEPAVCCQFDFKRLPTGGVTCPWNIPPVRINQANVQDRASILLDQYRKKSELFGSNVLLVPLGDDFRYDTVFEWKEQYENYQQLFTYMNSRKDWNVKAQFGTLSDYFASLKENSSPEQLPVLSGDFFTYADRDDHYWSGYYTSRPFYKRLDRVLIHYLRGAEILYSLAKSVAKKNNVAGFASEGMFNMIVSARRNMGLFQHHDGITGTAKDYVVIDYGKRMLESIKSSKVVISHCAQLLMAKDKSKVTVDDDAVAFDVDDHRNSHDAIADKYVINVGAKPRSLVVYNSLVHDRIELMCMQVSSASVHITDATGKTVPLQISPVLFPDKQSFTISETAFEACFLAEVPGLGMALYSLSTTTFAQSDIMAYISSNLDLKTGNFKKNPVGSTLTLEGDGLSARFNPVSGFLEGLKYVGDGPYQNVHIEFGKYGTVRAKDKSGAYLFLPDGEAQVLATEDNKVMVVDGPLVSTVHVFTPVVKHKVTLVKNQGVAGSWLRISNVVDITSESNFELIMRIKSDILNEDGHFFTDLNGLQLIKRKYFSKLPLQAQVYPMPAAAFLQDNNRRMSLLSAQPLGVASRKQGWLEVFLDRRLLQDDNRGLQQGVLDNKPTPNVFALTYEHMHPQKYDTNSRVGYLTQLGQFASHSLQYPLFALHHKPSLDDNSLQNAFRPVSSRVPCDVHLVNLRTLELAEDYSSSGSMPNVTPSNSVAIILQRFGLDCNSKMKVNLRCSAEDQIVLSDIIGSVMSIDSVEETSLTLTESKSPTSHVQPLTLQPMTLNTYKIHVKQ